MAITARKAVIIKRPTRLEQLISRFNTKQQAKFYIEHLDGDFSDYESEYDVYYRSLDEVIQSVSRLCRYQLIDWIQTTNFLFNPDDLVITVGQDGLIVNTLKYLGEQPIIGFNSDRYRWDGILAQFSPGEAPKIVDATLNGSSKIKNITKAIVKLSDSQELLAVNDFFLGVSDHGSARYKLKHQGNSEQHSSSGLIVSTPLGRSGWLKSIITGADRITNSISGNQVTNNEFSQIANWSEDNLYFAVREPFPSVNSSTNIVFGKITEGETLTVESKMGEKGIIFSDGIQNDYLNFNYSVTASFSVAKEKGRLVIKN